MTITGQQPPLPSPPSSSPLLQSAWAKQKKIKFTEHERAADIIWAKDGADMIGIIFD